MTVLTAVDGEDGSERVIAAGNDLATRLGEDLMVINVAQDVQDLGATREKIEGLVESISDDGEATVKVVQGSSEKGYPTAEPSGRVANRLLDEIEATTPDYAVLGSRKRTAVGKLALGSVAQLVIREADAPIVLVEQTA